MNRVCRFRPTSALAIWFLLSAATPYEKAVHLYENGKFVMAASLAETADTASSLALAARAILAHAVYVADRSKRDAEVQKGAELARKALAIDPGHVEAHLQLVVALHQQALTTTPINAYFLGYAAESLTHIKAALSVDPSNHWAHALLGGWHFEIVRLAGPVLSRILFEAELKIGRAEFTKAITLKPQSLLIQYEWARALLLNDPDSNRTEAVQLLNSALEATPADYLDKLIAIRARTVLDAMTSGSALDLSRALH